MNNLRKELFARNILKWFWVVLTLAALVFAFFLDWQYQLNKNKEYLTKIAKEIQLNLDGVMDDIFRDVTLLPLHGKSHKECSSELVPAMQKIMFANPQISGLAIASQKTGLQCATNNFIDKKLISSSDKLMLGPFYNRYFDKQYFLIQQQIGDFTIGVYLLDHVISKILQSPEAPYSIFLLNIHDSSNLSLSSDKLTIAKSKLRSVNNMSVVILSNPQITLKKTLYRSLLWAIPFVLFFILIYLQLRQKLTYRFSLTGLLQYALKKKQFFPTYQPLYDSRKKNFVGAEVLLRWHTESNELVQPDKFIDVAENSGLIVPMTILLIKKTFADCKMFLSQNREFHLAFNVSRQHFVDADFVREFISLCNSYAIDPGQIILELTERELLDLNNPVITKKIYALKDLGFSLAIDDFGTGHASISYLKNFPFNYLKIDKIYIQSIGTGAITETLIETIIQMASKLKLHIIAEGVESQEQLDYLSKHNVYLIQGWLFAQAMPAEEFLATVTRK